MLLLDFYCFFLYITDKIIVYKTQIKEFSDIVSAKRGVQRMIKDMTKTKTNTPNGIGHGKRGKVQSVEHIVRTKGKVEEECIGRMS